MAIRQGSVLAAIVLATIVQTARADSPFGPPPLPVQQAAYLAQQRAARPAVRQTSHEDLEEPTPAPTIAQPRRTQQLPARRTAAYLGGGDPVERSVATQDVPDDLFLSEPEEIAEGWAEEIEPSSDDQPVEGETADEVESADNSAESIVNGAPLYASRDYLEGGYCEGWDATGPCATCCEDDSFVYARGEYLAWWINGDHLPPLVTTAPSTTPRAQAGLLGQSTTSALFGAGAVNAQTRNGARVVLGWRFDPVVAIEGSWFGLGEIRDRFSGSSEGDPVLARPFYNLSTGVQDANLVAYPSVFTGAINAAETSQFMGGDFHRLRRIDRCGLFDGAIESLNLLYGFRYLGLYDNLTINTSSVSIDPGSVLPVGTALTTYDSFKASNSFYGADIGLSANTRVNRFTLNVTGRMSVGGTQQRITIAGDSTVTEPGNATVASAGGLLAMPTNIGKYKHGAFTLAPQLELKLGFDVTDKMRLTFGYDVMYWSQVVRPGEQIDLFVNPTQAAGQSLVGTPGPLFSFHESDVWVQGISAGLECRF